MIKKPEKWWIRSITLQKEADMQGKICIVGVAGGTASGKTTIVRKIKENFGDDIVVINHDSYYKAHNDLSYEDRSKLNYDHPDSFDTQMMIEDVKKLKNNEEVDIPVYDFSVHNRADATVHIVPKNVIILEGILVLENKELRDLMDIKVFVDTDADERLMRRIRRDMAERARSIESILNQYADTVKPMHEQFVEPSKKYADIIIPRGGENVTGINILQQHIKSMLVV
jgi:uridine kinase